MSTENIQALAEKESKPYALKRYPVRESYWDEKLASKARLEVEEDFENGFIEGSKLAIDTNPLVVALKKIKEDVWFPRLPNEIFRLNEVKNIATEALNNVQVVQPAKTDGGE